MVGVTRAQLFQHLLLEALALGLVGSLGGVFVGSVLLEGEFISIYWAQTINDLHTSL